MPLYREWSPDAHSLAAIWHVTEEEAFFRERTGLDPAIPSPLRRIEHLAGRFLLQHLKEDFPLLHISPDIHDKPRLPDDRYLFSISHSFPYVAAVVAEAGNRSAGVSSDNARAFPAPADLQRAGDTGSRECGIDIQVWRKGMHRLKHKYLSPEEQALFGEDERELTLAWCAKEAAYKWQGRRGIDFIEDMPVRSYKDGHIIIDLMQSGQTVRIAGALERDFAMALVIAV